MDVDGVLNVKAEAFAKAFGFAEVASGYAVGAEPAFAPEQGSEAFDVINKTRQRGRRDVRDLVALGTLATDAERGPSNARLGIFVQRHGLLRHPIVERARAVAKNEAEVIYTGPIRRQIGARSWHCRPLEIGASIGHYRVTAGTIGCFARRRADGEIGILSNNHVLANSNRAQIGDLVLQPGKIDGGIYADPRHHVAKLRDFVPIDFGIGAINRVDAAFAVLLPDVSCEPDWIGTSDAALDGRWRIGVPEMPIFPPLSVKKIGRTTGLTHGILIADNINNLNISFRFGQSYGTARFNGLISIDGRDGAFSKPGDSGALIFTGDARPVALLVAGSQTGGHRGSGLTFATPIDVVLDALDIDIYSELQGERHGLRS